VAGFVSHASAKKNRPVTLSLRNPLGLIQYSPYHPDGSTRPLIEARTGREVLLTVRWTP
jgi:hypothetical protein